MVGIVVLFFVFAACYLVIKALLDGTQRTTAPTENGSTPRIAYHGKSYPFSEIIADPNFPHVRSIRTKIRGVTFDNPDGANRQQIIRQWCHSGDALYLVREPNNPADRNAIQVKRLISSDVPDKPRQGELLGYLSRDLAERLAPQMDDGFVLMARITEVTGGEDRRSLGVNIQVEEYRPTQHPSPSHQKAVIHALVK
jgi:HIRAN domain